MSWNITVLTPNARRHTAKYTADTTLLQILEQASKKYGFNPEEYDITHHNRVLDTTLILRFSGLPNNASLEMSPVKCARVESEVVLGLQLENGNRLMGTFKPSTVIYDVLTSLVPDKCDLASNPVVIYMRKEIFGEESLRGTTLKSLGLTGGRAIVRLVHRTPEQLKTQANISTPLPQKQKEDELLFDHELPPGVVPKRYEPKSQINVLKVANELKNEGTSRNADEQMEVEEKEIVQEAISSPARESASKRIRNLAPEKTIAEDNRVTAKNNEFMNEVIFLGERNALVFSQEMISDMSQLDDLPEDFYDLTVDEVKKLFVELRKKREELENAPLLTSNIKTFKQDEEQSKKIQKNQKVVLRILFPNRTVLQGTFVPVDRIQVVKDFVASFLQNPTEPFDLYVTPPKKILSPDVTLLEAECIPSAVIHFGPIDKDPLTVSSLQYLKSDIMDKLTPPTAALMSASVLRN